MAVPGGQQVTPAERTRLDGNRRFKARDWEGAAALYSKALELLPEPEQRGAAAGVVLANRAAARLADARYEECLEDCSSAASCSGLSADLVRKLSSRQEKATAPLEESARLCDEARAALAARNWGQVMDLINDALKVLGGGLAADAVRADLLCDRSEARAAVGDFFGALADAEQSVRTSGTPRGHTAAARLTTFVENLRERGGGKSSAGDSAVETGLEPGASRLSSVRVTADCSVTLREVYLCTTGGRLWHAALLLANHLLSERTGCDVVGECRRVSGGARVLEVGAGLGLVGLALASALAETGSDGEGEGCTVTLTDCDRETNENLRQEVLLNSHRLVRLHASDLERSREPESSGQAEAGGGCAMAVEDLDYGPGNVRSSSLALLGGGAGSESAGFDLVVGSDTIFSETHASLGVALGIALAKPHGRGAT